MMARNCLVICLTVMFCRIPLLEGINTTERKDVHFDSSKLLEKILSNYDNRVIPSTGGPLVVEVRLHVIKLGEIKPMPSSYGMEVILHLLWSDDRLKYNISQEDGPIIAAGPAVNHLWIPDIVFAGQKLGYKSSITRENQCVQIHHDGRLAMSQRVVMSVYCPMEFSKFPFDIQDCSLDIHSYAYTASWLILKWKSGFGFESGIKAWDKNYIGKFSLIQYRTEGFIRTYGTSGDYSVLRLKMEFARKKSYYVVRIYLPMILIVVLSWSSFWIDYRSTPARTIMGSTLSLTVTTFIISIQATLPPVHRIKSVDIYMLFSFLFVFASLIEFAVAQTIDIAVRQKQKIGNEEKRTASSRDVPRIKKFVAQSEDKFEDKTLKSNGSVNTRSTRKRRGSSVDAYIYKFQTNTEDHENNVLDANNKPGYLTLENYVGLSRLDYSQLENGQSMTDRNDCNKGSPKTSKSVWKRMSCVRFLNFDKLYQVHEKHKESYHIVDKISKILFPVAFLIFNVTYFATFIFN